MKNIYCTMTGLFGAMLLALLFVPSSFAQCSGYRPLVTHANLNLQSGRARLLRAALVSDEEYENAPSIVGFWHVKFYSDGISSGIPSAEAPPKGAEVDAGYSQWHSDGTEIMNSGGRAPNTGDFCLGVWKQIGERKYRLNHFAAAWDPTAGPMGPFGPEGAIIGPGQIQEQITLAPNGESFTGSFSIDQYDESNNLKVHLEGTITGTRINVDTPESSVF
jgi:hypothetical protein